MVNETLCKVLCHNLVVLIHERSELGIARILVRPKFLGYKYNLGVVFDRDSCRLGNVR
jgi:hypothetical protein